MVRDAILHKIAEYSLVSVPITDATNLYTDLRFDSLSFIALLADIEGAHSVTIDIMEMEACLQVGQLIEMVETKMGERGNNHDQAFAAEQG